MKKINQSCSYQIAYELTMRGGRLWDQLMVPTYYNFAWVTDTFVEVSHLLTPHYFAH